MQDNERPQRWGLNENAHTHYSAAVIEAVKNFQIYWTEYQAYKKIDIQANIQRALNAQNAWDNLARLRKKETGVAFYLDPSQYSILVKG